MSARAKYLVNTVSHSLNTNNLIQFFCGRGSILLHARFHIYNSLYYIGQRFWNSYENFLFFHVMNYLHLSLFIWKKKLNFSTRMQRRIFAELDWTDRNLNLHSDRKKGWFIILTKNSNNNIVTKTWFLIQLSLHKWSMQFDWNNKMGALWIFFNTTVVLHLNIELLLNL